MGWFPQSSAPDVLQNGPPTNHNIILIGTQWTEPFQTFRPTESLQGRNPAVLRPLASQSRWGTWHSRLTRMTLLFCDSLEDQQGKITHLQAHGRKVGHGHGSLCSGWWQREATKKRTCLKERCVKNLLFFIHPGTWQVSHALACVCCFDDVEYHSQVAILETLRYWAPCGLSLHAHRGSQSKIWLPQNS